MTGLCSSRAHCSPWCLTFALGQLQKIFNSFFHTTDVEHPRFYRFRALASLHFFLQSTALNDLHQLDRPLIWLQMLLTIHGIVLTLLTEQLQKSHCKQVKVTFWYVYDYIFVVYGLLPDIILFILIAWKFLGIIFLLIPMKATGDYAKRRSISLKLNDCAMFVTGVPATNQITSTSISNS